MLKSDRFRIQALECLRAASKHMDNVELERMANEGVGLSDESRLVILQDMRRHGWTYCKQRDRTAITEKGRSALSKLKKVFV